jgi:hypothetical protein
VLTLRVAGPHSVGRLVCRVVYTHRSVNIERTSGSAPNSDRPIGDRRQRVANHIPATPALSPHTRPIYELGGPPVCHGIAHTRPRFGRVSRPVSSDPP